MTTKKPISREEALAGLGGRANKQANTVLTLIENRTSLLVAQAQQAGNPALAVAAAQNTRRTYLEAIAQVREQRPNPEIRDIERYAAHWATLVPENPTIRATLAHLLGQKYRFTAQTTPALSAALGLADEAVQQTYQRLYQQPVSAIYAPEVSGWEALRWRWSAFASRLENLPPFWLTFFLTVPGVSGLMALPMALSSVPPLWGVAFILLFGILNMITVAALAETVVRSGTARFGLGFLGQLAQEYLGQEMSILLTIAMALNNFVVLIIFFLGVSGTLAGATGLPITLWMLLPFVVCLYFLSRRSLNATVTTNLLIVFINLLILIAIPLLALPYFDLNNLTASQNTMSFTPDALGLMIGILSSTYLSHFLVATYGPVVLPRQPSGRGWIRGSMAAIAVLTVIACAWQLVLTGVLSPDVLRNATGTVVTPLAERVGSLVSILGVLLVTLSLGLTTIQVALAQYYSVEERLPRRGSASWVGKLSESQRFWLAISPMVLILLLSEWLAVSGTGSFASLLGILGALLLPLLIGILPILLLVATRRKGDFVPGYQLGWLGNPLLVGLLYLFFIGSVLIHGLYIWQSWPLRILALAGGLIILLVSWQTWRRGLTSSQTVIEVRHDERLKGQSQVQIVTNGQALTSGVLLDYGNRREEQQTNCAAIADFAALRRIHIQLPQLESSKLKLWVHHLPAEGGSLGVPAQVKLIGAMQASPSTSSTSKESGQLALNLPNMPCQVEIVLR
ncbi:MAG: hypothetical protein U0175_25170 [Caldilineaceae bacterium]